VSEITVGARKGRYYYYYYYYYYYLFTGIGFAPGGSGPYTTQLQQNAYNKNKYIP
jgi:hypothetical protein